jgi:aromatic-L-amino-acid/L-tryptophan decarboxylase
VPLQIVCCRYEPPGLDDIVTDSLNADLVATMQRRGIAAPSTCRIEGRLCIRISITNHRTDDGDLTILLQAIDTIGAELTTARQTGPRRAVS